MDITNSITHLSLCSGYEGIGIGLRRVFPSIREIAYVEREAYCAQNLVTKMEFGLLDPAPIHTDVKTFPYEKFRGCVNIMSFGFPCQPFSQAGKRNSTSDERHIFPYIARGIEQCRPDIIFGENVAGIVSAKTADGESVLKYVLRTMEQLGYRTEAGIFSAEECGAPHQRKRVFMLGLGNSSSNGCYKGRDNAEPRGASESSVNVLHEGAGQGEGRLQKSQRGCNATREPIELWDSWPARPGRQQYHWEAPRVVSYPAGKQGSSNYNGGKSNSVSESEQSEPRGGNSGLLRQSDGQAESRLGRTIDGSTSRVDEYRLDRLRLVGNGVVPATAAKAFKVLLNRLQVV